MATLKAMFKLFDGYSTTIDKISRGTDTATDKIINASRGTDNFNRKLEATGASANVANSGLKKLVGTFISLAAIKKGMDITDEFANTSARLNLINDGLQTQLELQDKIFAAADRSKGAYGDMANAVSRLQLLAGDAFASNDETIAFTELLQKSFKVGGAGSSEQSAAMLQLSQAMASGRLQGDEFVSISENAPLILEAISKYTGKSRGELKELSSDGAITADIIKNSMFAMADDINTNFETIPMTFADIWNKISNGALKAFRPIMEATSNLINSDGFMNIVNGVITGINILSKTIGWIINFIVDNWPIISSLLLAIGIYLTAVLLPGFLAVGAAGLWSGLMIAAAWVMANLPILYFIALLAGVIYMFQDLGITVEGVFGFVGGIIGVAVAGIWNLFLGLLEHIFAIINFLYNGFVVFTNFLGNVFKNPISSIIYLFQGMGDRVLGIIEKIASAIDFVFGSNLADAVSSWRSGLKDMADIAVEKYAPNESYQKIMNELDLSVSDFGLKRMEYGAAYTQGSSIGKNVYGNISGAISGLTDKLTGTGSEIDMSNFGTPSSPLTVEGKGKNKKLDVDMSEEDLRYLRDIAEREYINKFSTATLAPNIEITFGDVHEEADADKVAGRIKKILQEEIAIASEGAYA